MSASSRSLIQRITPYLAAPIPQNHRILSRNASSTALSEPQTSSPTSESIQMTHNFVKRMKELQADEGQEKMLRLSIEAGGCSGFQYNFTLDDKTCYSDRKCEKMKLFGYQKYDGIYFLGNYNFFNTWEVAYPPSPRIFERDGVKLVIDKISFDFVKGSTVDYVEELIRSAFQNRTTLAAVACHISREYNIQAIDGPLCKKVSANPSAVGECSCKSSFMIE